MVVDFLQAVLQLLPHITRYVREGTVESRAFRTREGLPLFIGVLERPNHQVTEVRDIKALIDDSA